MFLYIDPGTGSALFTIIIGIAATVVFAFQALYIKFKHAFSGGKAKHGAKNKFVIYAEDKRYYSLFKPVLEEFENRQIILLYLTSSKDDPVFFAGYQYIKPEYLGEKNKPFARLNFLSADFLLSTTPGLDVYQWKRSKLVKHYCHIFHSPEIALGYELYGIDYYDSVIVSASSHDRIFIRKLEEKRNLPKKNIITLGCPYLDEYAKKIEQIPNINDAFTVLISPTWGKSSLLSRFGEKLLDPLIETNWKVIIRPHPQSLKVEKEIIDLLSEKYKNNNNFIWDFESENIYSLNKADVMVSDFSGIILDYLFLCNKPVFYISNEIDFRPYDAIEIYNKQEDIWIFQQLSKYCIEINPHLLNELPSLIKEASVNADLKEKILKFKNEVWNYQGEAGKNITNFMIETTGKEVA